MAFLDELFRQITEGKKKGAGEGDDYVPGWDDPEECREGADDSNTRPEDYMDDKFEKCEGCNETTTSADIATVPMGFKGLKKDERTPVESVTEAYLDPNDPRPPVSVPSKLGVCKACGFKGLVRSKPGKGALCTDCYSKNNEHVERLVGRLVREAWGHMECPNCGAKVTGDTCPRCGEPIDESVQDDDTIPLPVITRPETALCHNCYEKQRQPGKRFCADCEKMMPKESVRESVDESVFNQLLHYKDSIPQLIGTIEGIVSANTPADSEELYDELAEVVTHLAKADHMLAVLVTSKNLRTPRENPEDEDEEEPEPEKAEPAEEMPHAGAPMDRPDETEDERFHAPRR